jgi:hypothetical protein
MKTLFRTVFALLLAGATLLAGCNNPVDAEKAAIVNSDAEAQVNALSAASVLLSGNSNYVSSLTSIVNALDGLTMADVPSIQGKIASMTSADPTFLKEMASLLAKYKLASTEDAKASAAIDILAEAAGEAARAKARKEACDAAAAAKSALESRISTLKSELSALTAKAESFDAYKALTSRTNDALADVADLIKPYYASSEALVSAFDGVVSKLGDGFLKSAVTEYAKVAAAEQSVIDLRNYLDAKIARLKELGVEEVDGKIAALQEQLETLLDPVNGIGKRVDDLQSAVDGIIADMSFAGEKGLKAYIDDSLIEGLEFLIGELNPVLNDIYDQLDYVHNRVILALQRIQSVVFVPEYEDLRMTVNYGALTQPVLAADGYQAPYAAFADLPTTVMYQILPAQYAKDIAQQILEFEYYRELAYSKYPEDASLTDIELARKYGIDCIIPTFEVISLQTRGGDTPDIQYGMEVLDVLACDTKTGYVTFKVLPHNIASASFAAAGLKPVEGVYMTGNTWDVNYRYEDYGLYWDPSNMDAGANYYNAYRTNNWVYYVFDVYDLHAYEARSAFGVQLHLYQWQDYDIEDESNPDNIVYIDYENELASAFTTLYPNNAGGGNIEITDVPYKYLLDATGYPVIDPATGVTMLDPLPAEIELPADLFPGNASDPNGGYRYFLDGVLPVVSVDGMNMSAADAKEIYGIDLGLELPDEAEIDFDGLDESLFIVDSKTYAKISMNPKASAAARAAAVGHTIKARYYINAPLGTYFIEGKVKIVGAG